MHALNVISSICSHGMDCVLASPQRSLIKEHRVLAIHSLELDCELFSSP